MRGPAPNRLPVAAWLRGCRPSWLRLDLIAGAATAAAVVPQGIAYAAVVGPDAA